MINIEKIRFSDLIKKIKLRDVLLYQEKLAVIEISKYKENDLEKSNIPLRVEASTIFFIEKGEIKLYIDYVPHTITENSFVILSEIHIIQLISLSDDIKGYNLIMLGTYLRSLLKNEIKYYPNQIQPIIKDPSVKLLPEEFSILLEYIKRIINDINRTDNIYQDKIIDNELVNLVLEVWNFKTEKNKNIDKNPKQERREKIVVDFIKLLLKHSLKEREVNFYADKLFVSPVYLSRSVKHFSGLPAIKMINNFAISDAKLLLKNPNMSIKEIAEEMNFSDQAAFSKFFKKETGMSPLKYKEL